jgi:hypothetical protein
VVTLVDDRMSSNVSQMSDSKQAEVREGRERTSSGSAYGLLLSLLGLTISFHLAVTQLRTEVSYVKVRFSSFSSRRFNFVTLLYACAVL